MTTFQKLSSFRPDDAQELGHVIQKYVESAAVEADQDKVGAKAEKAVIMSYYPHGSGGAIRLNLKWGGPHQVNDFNFDSAGEVQDSQTETEHTGWVILRPHGSVSVQHLLLRGAISLSGLYYGTKFPLALPASNRKLVRREGRQRFWRFVRQRVTVLAAFLNHTPAKIKACRKGNPEAKAVTVDQSPVAPLANASEITGLPRDNFEIH